MLMVHTEKTPNSPIPLKKEEYHFEVENLSATADGKFVHSYGTEGQYSHVYGDLPAWARTTEKANQILDGSSNPTILRENFDKLYNAAETDYLKGNGSTLETKSIAETIQNQDDRERLINICQLKISDEEKSNQGDAMSGTHNSQLIKLHAIIEALKP
jgi:hypothetical protein